MIYGFELRKLRIIGNDEKISEFSFKSGLNVIAGPSNTGKTYIFECINFMLGGTELPDPIDEAVEGQEHIPIAVAILAAFLSYRYKFLSLAWEWWLNNNFETFLKNVPLELARLLYIYKLHREYLGGALKKHG